MGIAAIISLLGPVIITVIQSVQKLFPGHKTDTANNTTKLQTVMSSILPILQSLATAGKTPGSVIPAELEAAVEAVLALLKTTPGALEPPLGTTPTTVNGGTLSPAVYQISGTFQARQ